MTSSDKLTKLLLQFSFAHDIILFVRKNALELYGALAQLVARYIRIVEVTGSNPVCSTKPQSKG